MPSSNTNISARLRRTLSSQLFLCRLLSFQPPRLLKMIRKYPCSVSAGVGRSQSRGRIDRLQPCKAPGHHAHQSKGVILLQGDRGGKKKWFPMGFFLPSDARSSSSERVTGRFTAPVQRQRLPRPLLIPSCSSPVLLLRFLFFFFWFSLLFS